MRPYDPYLCFLFPERCHLFRQREEGGLCDRAEDGLAGDPGQEPRVPLQPPGTGARAAHDGEHDGGEQVVNPGTG